MLKKRIPFLLLLLASIHGYSAAVSPKLVLVISLDQFRYDYLTRFREHFGKGGFNYLLEHGANFANATYKHSLNLTGPGHAVILSGSYGNTNGIIGNNWYDSERRRQVYCVEDERVRTVGANVPGMSPSYFIGSTFGDELRLASAFRSKVISISNKDRTAVLLGGKLANASYWMVDSAFITSTYYMNTLPPWVQAFNRSGKINSYHNKVWNRALPEKAYEVMDADDVPYEGGGNGLGRTFPHKVSGESTNKITASYFSALLTSPFGSEVLNEFAKRAITEERLGQRSVTDLLCVGFSSNDYVGHSYGPHSHEVMDMTVRTDRILADLFSFIDQKIGLKNCVIVLTSDHGVAPIPEFILRHNTNADVGRVRERPIKEACSIALTRAFGPPPEQSSWIEAIASGNVYLNRRAIRERKLSLEAVSRTLADSLAAIHPVAAAYTRSEMMASPHSVLHDRMRRSYHPSRSGDVFVALKPFYFMAYYETGTTHGEPYEYDSHVPVILMGNGIQPGTYHNDASPADIAPTLSALLGIGFPAEREGKVLAEAMTVR